MEPIPEPPGWPIVGNLLDVDTSFPLATWLRYGEQYGDIFRVHLPGRQIVFVGSQALVHEVCDEKRFYKGINAVLNQVRNGVHDGLFTASMDEPNWGIAHRVLMPAFGPMPIQGMFSEMHDIAVQLALKWARHDPGTPIRVTDDFTRLTLDTLALCAMGFRFNSFYHDEMHPFISAMGSFLTQSGARATQPGLVTALARGKSRKYWDDIATLRKTAEDVLNARKAGGGEQRKDLMSAMLEGVDSKTGLKLSDASIIDNLITFLIAGHETTSGLLSFAFYQLLKSPEAYAKAQKEVDDVIGTGPIKPEHMNKLPYVTAVLRETLRLSPTIPTIGVTPKKDEIIGGKYLVEKGQSILMLLAQSQTDPAVHGDSAREFQPERMLDANFERLSKEFPDFWKPFGNGMRGCIGRPFAWQEAMLVMAMLLQNFTFTLDDPAYVLQMKQTLTTKPKDFYMRAALRDGMTPTELAQRLNGGAGPASTQGRAAMKSEKKARTKAHREGKPMAVYYGSNTGTCEAFAQRLAGDAPLHGYEATIVAPLDEAANIKKMVDGPVVIITASYEGQPPDNAGVFCKWLEEEVKGDELRGCAYAVFGCGHHDWAQTFHRIPKLVDERIAERGGERVCAMGLADAAEGEMFTDFEQWEDEVFWPGIEAKYGAAGVGEGVGEEGLLLPTLEVEFSTPRSSRLRQDVKGAVVTAARVLTGPGAREKKHLEVQLPAGMTYQAGDYLAVLPINLIETVNRVMRRFHLAWDANVTIESDGLTSLPTGVPVPVYDVLASYVELSQPATKKSILALANSLPPSSPLVATITALTTPSQYTTAVSRPRLSLLDLLDRFPSAPLPFSTFLALLPPLRVRQYSISSSPLCDPARATLTYSVLAEPSLADPDREYVGVASGYLAGLTAGDAVNVAVRKSNVAFSLPAGDEVGRVPVVMIAAGAGLAPFRGFIQERAALVGAGREVAEGVLFFGCRGRADDIYREEMERWEAIGAVKVRRAYSREEGAEVKGCKYVQDRLWEEREELMALWEKGAKIYVCGSRGVGESVKKVVVRIAMEMQRLKVEREGGGDEPSEQQALKWFEGIRNVRYATDVFD